ncbi:hypothetical protein NZNM25_10240 [Nitrosopumilus zosterae]|uniref:Uncharacterized protein n=1 Tax=Nitrosopumilus zosterae TaxID=718286 RepID=A0A2S2KRF9_9ARCH|nr:hypothetical protein [Nitrosopumilus zosterae]BDQ30333.1 hypothetical protein NZOSNM25_000435 [Nitrosopumilus zosterae]GBH34233.1 hypothetical protein NZNM25_10240 [Nitrosopumilus zosterae]
MTKLLYASIIASVIVMSVFSADAFAQSDFKKIEGDDLNNPVSQDILAKIEFAKKQFMQAKETENKRNAQQKLIDEQRAISQESLKQELQRMEKTYEEFTPRNAFAKYVSNLNATNHGIFWDQFDYLHAKISLARDARDSVIKQGGTFSEAMKQYVQFAKMPKIEMQNIVRELNIKHNLAQEDIQSNFDMNGKLPRYENDIEAPCYGCTAKISKVQIDSKQSVPITRTVFEPKPTQISDLKDSLSDLQSQFLESKNIIAQKKMVFEMNEIIKRIQELQ